MKTKKAIDFTILLLIQFISIWYNLSCGPNFLLSTITFYGLPIVYIVIKRKSILRRTFVFSSLFSIPLSFIYDYLIAGDNGWYITSSIFPFRIFGIVVIEQFVWGFLWLFYITNFYEYFSDQKLEYFIPLLFFKLKKILPKRMEKHTLFFYVISLVFIFIHFYYPSYLKIQYAYLIIIALTWTIPFAFLFTFPNFTMKFVQITVYFFFLNLMFEYIGLKFNYWSFPGEHFIGRINFFGHSIPFEEIISYFILSTLTVLSYYQYLLLICNKNIKSNNEIIAN
jgi:hypothetical protein